MVALNEHFAPVKTDTQPKNRVGDFFLGTPIASGSISLQAASASGKNGVATTILRQVLITTASDIMMLKRDVGHRGMRWEILGM